MHSKLKKPAAAETDPHDQFFLEIPMFIHAFKSFTNAHSNQPARTCL